LARAWPSGGRAFARERVERREIDRLVILMPPRHRKSELALKSYPAWALGRNPWKQIISRLARTGARRSATSSRRRSISLSIPRLSSASDVGRPPVANEARGNLCRCLGRHRHPGSRRP
jgi:hypothetical protein